MPAADKRQPGQAMQIPARAWNRMVDVADWWQEQQRLGQGGDGSQFAIELATVNVKNVTGSNQASGSVLEITASPLLDDAQLSARTLWFNGDTPEADGRTYGVLRQAVAANDIGKLQLAGVCLATVNVSDASHTRARLATSSTTLASSAAGPVQIVYKPTGTGELTCCVLLGLQEALRWCRFSLTESLATTDANAAAQVELASWSDDTGESITVQNHEASSDYIFEGNSGDFGTAVHRAVDDTWHILIMECP